MCVHLSPSCMMTLTVFSSDMIPSTNSQNWFWFFYLLSWILFTLAPSCTGMLLEDKARYWSQNFANLLFYKIRQTCLRFTYHWIWWLSKGIYKYFTCFPNAADSNHDCCSAYWIFMTTLRGLKFIERGKGGHNPGGCKATQGRLQ